MTGAAPDRSEGVADRRDGGTWTLIAFAEIDSTQAEATRRLAAGERLDPTAIEAVQQTAGVGRYARRFESPVGGSWQTLIVPPEWLARRSAPPSPVRFAVAIAAELGRHCSLPLALKWPNDLWRLDAAGAPVGKIGGVLAELRRGHLLLGVGLNAVNAPPAGGARLDLPPHIVGAAVRDAVAAAFRGEPASPSALPHLLDGRRARFEQAATEPALGPGFEPAGTVLHICEDGGLHVRGDDGRTFTVRSGSVAEVEPPLLRG